MKNPHLVAFLIVGLFLSFGIGYWSGSLSSELELSLLSNELNDLESEIEDLKNRIEKILKEF